MTFDKHNCYCIIMAGGIGSRFWPLSREEKPKQFVDALGIGRTFIQLTYDRFSGFIPSENFLVLTGEVYKDLVLEQLPQLSPQQILTEPCRRNTAPCIAYAMYNAGRTGFCSFSSGFIDGGYYADFPGYGLWIYSDETRSGIGHYAGIAV